MKHFSLLVAFIGSLVLFSCGVPEKENKEVVTSSINKIEVIDFYGAHRCVTCKDIEANAKYTVDTYFPEEQKNGIIEFKTVNVDDDSNYDISAHFEATGTALFLNVIVDGKENHIDLTDFAFMKATNQEEFSEELKTKIEVQLASL